KWGLVNRVVPHEALLETVHALASDIRSNDQVGVRQMLETYSRTAETTVADGWRIEASMGTEWLKNSDFRPEKVAQRRVDIQNRGRAQQNP
ncbi:MAG: enoyl-CoA hydratase, partial [Acidimicrobiales bacterium]